MAPLPRPACLLLALLTLLPLSARAQSEQEARDRMAALKAKYAGKSAQAAPASASSQLGAPAPAAAGNAMPAGAAVLFPRSDVGNYLASRGERRPFYRADDPRAAADDEKKLQADAELAVKAYEAFRGRVTTNDDQKFVSTDFFMRTGDAEFNPNRAQTSALVSSLNGMFAAGPVLQTDAIYAGLVATNGNLTLAMGSLAQAFNQNRAAWVPKVADMKDAEGKNYYRYAGFFIGLHDAPTRAAGAAGAYGNIAGNPIVYSGYEVYSWWRDVFQGKGGGTGIDSARTFSSRGKVAVKGGELEKGFAASEKFRP